MTTAFVPTALSLLLAMTMAAASAQAAVPVGFDEEFDDLTAWHSDTGFLDPDSVAFSATVTAGVADFSVPEIQRGVVWITPMGSGTPYFSVAAPVNALSFRYNVTNIRATDPTDYVLYFNGVGATAPYRVNVSDLVLDGAWHTFTATVPDGDYDQVFLKHLSDDNGSSHILVDYIRIRGPNHAPEIVNVAPAITLSQPAVGAGVDLDATDADAGDALTWSILSQPGAGTGTAAIDASSGLAGYAPPDSSYVGSTSFVAQVSDGSDTDTVTVMVTVTAAGVGGATSIPASASGYTADSSKCGLGSGMGMLAGLLAVPLCLVRRRKTCPR